MSANLLAAEALAAARRFFPSGAELRVAPVTGGANNRVWRVEAQGGPFLLKQYYQAPAPARDRYASERAFYAYAMPRVLDAVPHALGWNDDDHAGLFAFVAGRKLWPAEVTAARVAEALEFFRALNLPPASPPPMLPEAAEACFSVEAHLAIVDKRIQRLRDLPPAPEDELTEAARKFVHDELAPAWLKIADAVRHQLARLDSAPPARCVSPSDFGFHNALLGDSNRLCFFDFEYAGWDDPAKTVGDFLCQPDIPAGPVHRDQVLNAVAAMFPQDQLLPQRARALLPVYQIKWCGIVLNEFLPVERQRRDYALSPAAAGERRRRQLERARAALSALAAA
ncbi:MAG TPA: phosphotransferase [Opitutales bacterium]|nr:phosphotransferase [Opitutales bacterium]